jgi:hypothetical protein
MITNMTGFAMGAFIAFAGFLQIAIIALVVVGA